MPDSTGKKLFFLFLSLWFAINFLQAIFTEINADEAYYYFWGQYPAWGYFDHPPFVGWMTFISSALFDGNLGARFMTLIFQVAALYIIWLQLDLASRNKRSVIIFFIVSASMAMFIVYGFITTPDAPLLFFTALFLYGYKNFLKKKDGFAVLILAVSLAGLIYSKYHGALVIGFVILSNLRLLVNPKFWFSGVLALTLLLPHFWWLYTYDFPGFKYQFAAFDFKLSHFLEYIPSQLAAFNPLTLGAVIYIFFFLKPAGRFERALYFIIAGFIFFFWALAFKGHVQAQWTVAASVPAIIILNNKIAVNQKLFTYTRRFIAPSLILLLAARVLFMTDLLPRKMGLSGKEAQYRAFEKSAGGQPVVFTRAYQQASLFHFFTGKPADCISSLVIRRSQFDLWNFHHDWARDSVFIVLQENRSNIYVPSDSDIRTFFTDHLQVPNGLRIEFRLGQHELRIGDSLKIDFKILNSTIHDFNFKDAVFPCGIILVFRGRSGYVFRTDGVLKKELTILKKGELLDNSITFTVPKLPEGKYQLGLSCNSIFGPADNSNFIKIEVKK